MKFRKGIVLLLSALSVTMVLVGCSTGSGSKTENQSKVGNRSKEPTIVSANESKTWPGADLVVTFDYEKEMEKSQVKVMIGGIAAEIKYCSNNQVSIKAPNGLTAGTQSITATVNGKDSKEQFKSK